MSIASEFVPVGDINAVNLPVRSREIAPGIHWLSSCSQIEDPKGVLHLHTSSAYLICGTEKTVLLDVGSPFFEREMESVVADILGDRTLDWIFPTHLEHAHAGGLTQFAARYPDAPIIADSRDYDYYFPNLAPRVVNAKPGDQLDLGGGYRFTFLPAPMRDLATTLWGHEESQQVMFVSDGFSFVHREESEDLDASVHLPEECTLMLSELSRRPTLAEAAYLNRAALWWTHHRPIAPFVAAIRELLAEYPTTLIAPAHGGVIDEIEEFIPIMEGGCDIAYEVGASLHITTDGGSR